VQDGSLHKRFFLSPHEDFDMRFEQKLGMRKKLFGKNIVPTIPKIKKTDLNFLIAWLILSNLNIQLQ
jgi:hypothetical protein